MNEPTNTTYLLTYKHLHKYGPKTYADFKFRFNIYKIKVNLTDFIKYKGATEKN